jgi:hypothetical protein
MLQKILTLALQVFRMGNSHQPHRSFKSYQVGTHISSFYRFFSQGKEERHVSYSEQTKCDLPKVLAASDTIWVKRT